MRARLSAENAARAPAGCITQIVANNGLTRILFIAGPDNEEADALVLDEDPGVQDMVRTWLGELDGIERMRRLRQLPTRQMERSASPARPVARTRSRDAGVRRGGIPAPLVLP